MATPFAMCTSRPPSCRSLRLAVGAKRSTERAEVCVTGAILPGGPPGCNASSSTQLRTSAQWLPMAGALFEQDGSRFLPTELARGAWTPQALHGGPPAALLARCAERVPGGESMMVSRLTVELLRPVPVSPLSVHTPLLRPGRKVQLVGASLHVGEVEVARATALRIRTLDLPLPPDVVQLAPPPGPERGEPGVSAWKELIDHPAFHNQGVEHRFVAGSVGPPGPATHWVRLRVPVVARLAAIADFGNGVSWVLSRNDGW